LTYNVSYLFDHYNHEVAAQAKVNEKIWLVDSDSTYMASEFIDRFPERLAEVGIAEQNLIGVAAGIASTGKIVFANTMANFLTLRALEQIKVDIIYNGFNVKLVSSMGGVLAGVFGPTHQALEDVAVCRSMPFMKVVVPADGFEVTMAVRAAAKDNSPYYIRLERGEPVQRAEEQMKFEVGKATVFLEGKDLTFIAYGSMVGYALQAATILAAEGIDAGVIDMHTVKPIDENAILKAGTSTGAIVTLEEHQITGGLGSAVAEVIAEKAGNPIRLKRMGIEDTLIDIVGNPIEILRELKLTPPDIARRSRDFLLTIRQKAGRRDGANSESSRRHRV
jgi:transketolase